MGRVLAAIARHARSRPAAIAVSSPSRVLTYGKLEAEIERTALKLLAMQPLVRAGAPVAVRLENGPAWVVLDLALAKLGWVNVAIPAAFTPVQCERALASAGVGLLLRATEAASGFEVAGERIGATPLHNAAAPLPVQTAKIAYTSGATGEPKGVCLSRPQLEQVAASLVEVTGLDGAVRHLPLLPLSALLETVAGLYATLLAGGCYDVLPLPCLGLGDPRRPDLGQLTRAIRSERATSLIMTPELLGSLLMVMNFMGVTFPDLQRVIAGGASVPPHVLAQAEALGLPVYEGYGLSECASIVALNTPRARKAGAVGKPLPHLNVRIAVGGEIVVGPEPFLGYAGGGVHLGPMRTGDLGGLDDDGFLRVDGRRSGVGA